MKPALDGINSANDDLSEKRKMEDWRMSSAAKKDNEAERGR